MGWTSAHIAHSPTEQGKEKLVYLAKVTRKLTFEEYWKQYPQKQAVYTEDKDVWERYGDNIYKPDVSAEDGFIQMPNVHHGADKKAKDLKGKNVLICEEFYYFSCLSPLEIPSDLCPNIPKMQTRYGMITKDASAFVNYVRLHTNQCKYTDAK